MVDEDTQKEEPKEETVKEEAEIAKDSEAKSEPDKASEGDTMSTEGSEARGDAKESSQASTAAMASSEDAPEKPQRQDPEQAEEHAPKKKDVKPVSKELEKIIEQIEKLSVLELSDLVHALEDRFGVTATAPVATAPSGAEQAGGGEHAQEQTTFNIILAQAGANKIGVIKAVRELVPTLGLKEAKDLVEAAPKSVMEGVNKETANEAKNKLSAAGATVELQ